MLKFGNELKTGCSCDYIPILQRIKR
jgi:hypothetical protein